MSLIYSKQLELPQNNIYVGGSTGQASLLPIGTLGQVLTVTANGLEYQNVNVGSVIRFAGTLDASQSSNLPSSPDIGDMYKITVAGNFGGSLSYNVNVGDFIAYTSASTWSKFDNTDSTVTGTTNRITVSGSTETGYTVDISSTYIGQASITTVGTITTGTWNGSTVGTAFGGTGLTTLGTAGQVLRVNTGGSGLEYYTTNISSLSDVAITTPVNGQVLTYNGSGWLNSSISYSSITDKPTPARAEATAVGGANESFTNFFTAAPIAETVTVYFGAVKLKNSGYTISGTTLILVDSVNKYSTDAGDVISATYQY